MDIARPKIEGSVAVSQGRRLGFAEFGSATGRAVLWLHGTPGARRQIPVEARASAEAAGIRLIGVDRPGVGASTAHRYPSVADFPADLFTLADTLGIDKFAVIGLSGGGPYALATAWAAPDRVPVAGVLGGVAPAVGPEAISSHLMDFGKMVSPMLGVAGPAIGTVLSRIIRVARPIANPAIAVYGRLSPEGDRLLLQRPEFRAMFLDDLLSGGRRQMEAPFADVVLFCQEWGFRLADVTTPVRWWHGDRDHIVPYSHGEHAVALLPDAKLYPMHGESHLGGMALAQEVLGELMAEWDRVEGSRTG